MNSKSSRFIAVVLLIAITSVSASATVIKKIGSSDGGTTKSPGADFLNLSQAFAAINNDIAGTTYTGAIELQIIDNITNNNAAILYSKGGVSSIAKGTSPAWVNYSTAPTVTISAPDIPGGEQATATVTTAGVFTVTNQGSGYTSVPTVTLSGGSGGNANNYATATIANNNWTSVKIYPTVSGKTISYTTGTFYPVECRGGDNLTIDGRLYDSSGTVIGSTPDLTIYSVSMIMAFKEDASNNTLTYCNLKGVNTGSMIALQSASVTGNNYNTISYNNITSSTGVRSNTVINLADAAGVGNNYTTISNNNIYDCIKTSGIYFGKNNTYCTISGNSFYETAAVTQVADTKIINIFDGSNLGLVVENNYIGGSAAQCSGTWTTNTAATGYAFSGIYIRGNADVSKKSVVRGNIIKGFDWNTLNTVGKNWVGIDASVNDGYVDITGNTIGEVVKKSTTDALAINHKGNCMISNNFIYGITSTAAGSIYGLNLNGGGNVDVVNNVISLGGIGTSGTIYAIVDPGSVADGTKNFYHNTVNVWGTTAETGEYYSMAFYNSNNLNTRNLRNNLFVNTRVKGNSATGAHYAYYLAVAANTNLTSNYNDYYVSPTGVLGYFNGAPKTTLADIQTSTGGDVNSVNVNPLFANASGNAAENYVASSLSLAGVNLLAIVPADYNVVTRTTIPTMGAHDYRIWNGTAWNTVPTANYNAKIDGTFSGAGFNCRNLVLNAGKQLSISSGTLAVANNFTIMSDAANGTGTFVNSSNLTIGGTTTVQQYLPTTRNWYISSPVTGAVAPVGYTYYQRDEAGASWTSLPFVSGNTFTPGKGYIALPGTAASTISFTGTLNSGNVTIPLTWSGATSKGFNLIGNPYPSHLTWTQAFVESIISPDGGIAPATLIEPSVYIRANTGGTSNTTGVWSFQTYNATTGLAVPNNSLLADGIIPPMQAFWVRSKQAGNLILTNTLTKSHQTGNPLKVSALKNTDRKLIRLEVSNGTKTDETLLFFDSNAENTYDRYDSPKFGESNTEVQIYTSVGHEKLVMNGLNSIQLDTPIGVGFIPGSATSFSIRANEISNLPSNIKVILRDNVTLTETDITDGSKSYQFGPETNTSDRFSLIFRASGYTMGLDNTKNLNLRVFVNSQNQIIIIATERANYSIYNAMGQLIEYGKVNNEVRKAKLNAGMYIVKVSENGRELKSRIIIK